MMYQLAIALDVVHAVQQQPLMSQFYFWTLLIILCLLLVVLAILAVLYTIDFVSWIVKAVKLQRQWMRERKRLQQINKIKTTSFKGRPI